MTNTKKEYWIEYYKKNRKRLSENAKRRYYQDKIISANQDFTSLDEEIKKILGHDPEWWEREYFIS